MRREDYEDSPVGAGMDAVEAADIGELSAAFEARNEPANRLQTESPVVLVTSILLLAAGCAAFRRYWLQWRLRVSPTGVSARSLGSAP